MRLAWTRFNKYIYKYWKLQTLIILLGFLVVPLGLLNPYLTKFVIDKAYGNRDLKLFFILAAIGGMVFIVKGILEFFTAYLSKRVNRCVHFDMTRDFFKHLQKLPLSFFNSRSTGEHIYRINSDVRSVSDFVCNTIPQMVTLFPRLLFIIAIVFSLNRRLAILTALLVPISYVHPYLFGRWLREITRKTIMKTQGIFKELQEVLSHIHLIKALGKEKHEIVKFEKNLTKQIELELKNAKVLSIGSFSSSILNKALSGVIALYGGYQVIKGTMTLGSLTAIMIYLTQLMGVLSSIGKFYQTITVNSVTRQRLSEILDIKPSIYDSRDALPLTIKKGSIAFKDVYFGYNKNIPVLKEINFLIKSAGKVAFVGISGCGKTTILSLILRLYEQSNGTILIDGVDTRKIKLDSLKSQIGVALQEPFLWNDTIANNILYGAENATSEDLIKASRLSEAHDFITGFPNGYDSIIGEMACKISEGQKQRIALARAVIKRPKILLLDEALSSLDSETEDRAMANIREAFEDSTILVVSHRLSTIRKMDVIYLFSGGTVMASGSHEELFSGEPAYRELFAGQLDGIKYDGISR
ncbi:MAG: ABC transporter ATP-binding protein [Candidatus Omnitrophota bacterium]